MDKPLRWMLVMGLVTGIASLPQSDIDRLASDMSITAGVVTNLAKSGKEHTVSITLTNTGNGSLPTSGWRVYFHSFFLLFPPVFPSNKSIDLDTVKVKVSMIQGDLYAFEPLPGFEQLQPGDFKTILITAAFWSVARTDFMPNWYVTSSDGSAQPRILASTRTLDFVTPFTSPKQWKRYDFDQYNPFTAQERKQRLHVNDAKKALKMIIPTPLDVTIRETGTRFRVDESWRIYCSSAAEKRIATVLSKLTGIPTTATSISAKVIQLSQTSKFNATPESYEIEANGQKIVLIGYGEPGLFYAVQSLSSLLIYYNNNDIPEMTIEDGPRYPYRGMHVDVARNFHTVDDVKRLMGVMAMYKMNKLHFHLADDEGWRLEIPGLPELTEISSKRCHDLDERSCIIPQYGSGPFTNTSGTGFYTTDDYKSILQFAKDNYIEIVPEFDMPGHAHAAIIAMKNRYRTLSTSGKTEADEYRLDDPDDESVYISVQQWSDNAVNPCIESTYRFISKVVQEVSNMHRGIQPLSTYHFGGDEVANEAWTKSPKCLKFLHANPSYNVSKGLKKYFAERVADITNTAGLEMRGWEDGFMDADGNPFPLSDMNNSRMSANPWDNIWEWGASQRAYRLANDGYKVVMAQATNLYFDQPQEPDPEERGLYWATRFTDTYKVFGFLPDSLYDNIHEKRSGQPLSKTEVCGANMAKCDPLNKTANVIGIQGNLWSETVRSGENLDNMIFPRLLALAERSWHKAKFESLGLDPATRKEMIDTDWMEFANTLGYKELQRLDNMGVKYRVPPPGASFQGVKVKASTTFPGLTMQYKRDGQPQWRDVTDDLEWNMGETGFFLKTLSADRQRESRHVQLFEDPLPEVHQTVVDYIASAVTARIEVVDNLNKVDNYMTVRLHLTNIQNTDVKLGNWRIHLYSLYGFKVETLSCGLRVGHVNGGLFFITPSPTFFKGIGAGKTLTCTLRNHWWSVSRTDQMPNWYVSAKGMTAKVMVNTVDESLKFVGAFDTPAKWKRTNEDRYNPYKPEERYNMYTMEKTRMNQWSVVPTPKSSSGFDYNKVIRLQDGWAVQSSMDFAFESKFLAEKLQLQLTNSCTSRKCVKFVKTNLNNGKEAYVLEIIPPNTVTIKAEDVRGALHGVQTLISLAEGSNSTLPKIKIEDNPRFEYRGIMIDVARNFKPKDWLLKVLDLMSVYKLNKLHLHLSDDEGWRVEIPGLPELTQVGGKRCHTDEINACVVPALGSGPDSTTSGSGYYTVTEYREILKYAADRHIDVIPEIDMPGHSSAAITSMFYRDAKIADRKSKGETNIPESYTLSDADMDSSVESVQRWKVNAINPCLNTSFDFVEKLVNEFKMLHSGVMPLEVFHIGGDEVSEGAWDQSEHCKHRRDIHAHDETRTKLLQKEFVTNVANIIADRNLSMAAWEDGMYAQDRPNPITDHTRPTYVYAWGNRWDSNHARRVSEFADADYKVILALATHLYLDHPYEPDPEERGLYWAARFVDTRKMFGLVPEHVWWNADVDRMGIPADLAKICDNKPCPDPTKPENVIGMQGSMFSETVRTEDQLHYMLFPRFLALAERAWHKAPWENMADKKSRDAGMKTDWEDFAAALGNKEFTRLEKRSIKYRVPPPGGVLSGGQLRVNTLYPNHEVEFSLNASKTWEPITHETTVPPNTESVLLRSKSPYLKRVSRVIEVKPTTAVTAGSKVTACFSTFVIVFLSATLYMLT